LSKKARGRGYSLLWAECLKMPWEGETIKDRETTGDKQALSKYQGLS